jgi:hypothetical protein
MEKFNSIKPNRYNLLKHALKRGGVVLDDIMGSIVKSKN